MITSLQFEAALKVIADYKTQLVKRIKINASSKKRTINLQKQLSSGTYKALRNYYKNEYRIFLDWNNLVAMDEKLLATIEFDKLLNTRGFGRVALSNFKKLLILNGVVIEDPLNK
jgi:hypothetical protein